MLLAAPDSYLQLLAATCSPARGAGRAQPHQGTANPGDVAREGDTDSRCHGSCRGLGHRSRCPAACVGGCSSAQSPPGSAL